MATNAYFEPYEYYQGDKVVGIDADMAQAVCDVLGYELKIEDMEFDSIINAIQSGKADIGVCLLYTSFPAGDGKGIRQAAGKRAQPGKSFSGAHDDQQYGCR